MASPADKDPSTLTPVEHLVVGAAGDAPLAVTAPCFFAKLPVELHQRIMEYCMAIPQGIDPRIRASLIICCKAWYDVICNAPIFWSHVSFHPKLYSCRSAALVLEAYLSRSGKLLLLVDIQLDPKSKHSTRDGRRDEPEHISPLNSAVHRTVQRARSLRVALPRHCFPLPLPESSSFSEVHVGIHGNRYIHRTSTAVQVFSEVPEQPSRVIKNLWVSAGNPLVPNSFAAFNVVHLDLCWKTRDRSSLFGLLSSLPLLETLVVYPLIGSFRKFWMFSSTSTATLAKLRSLDVVGEFIAVFRYLHLPHLTHLRVSRESGRDLEYLLEHLAERSEIRHLYASDFVPTPNCMRFIRLTLLRVSIRMQIPLDNDCALKMCDLFGLETLSNVRLVCDGSPSHQPEDHDDWLVKQSHRLLLQGSWMSQSEPEIVFDLSSNNLRCGCKQFFEHLSTLMESGSAHTGRIVRVYEKSDWDMW